MARYSKHSRPGVNPRYLLDDTVTIPAGLRVARNIPGDIWFLVQWKYAIQESYVRISGCTGIPSTLFCVFVWSRFFRIGLIGLPLYDKMVRAPTFSHDITSLDVLKIPL